MAAPGAAERLVATLHVAPARRDGSIVASVVEAAGVDAGLSPECASHLARAAQAVSRAVYELGFDDPEDAAVDLSIATLGDRMIVRIDDRGLPFNADAEDSQAADVVAAVIAGGWVDAIEHESRGRDGNRTTLVRRLGPGPDLRVAGAPEAEPLEIPDLADVELVTRQAGPADAERICQLAWRTYGYSYQHDEYYQPERLAAMLESGQQASFVVALPDGTIIGHSAVLLDEPGAVVVEGGRAMVDPRFRGHHLLSSARDLREGWLHEHGVLAVDGAAVTAHTRSQTDRPICSLQLGFLPAIEFKGITGTDTPRREAVAGGLTPVAPIPEQRVVLPARDEAMLAEIYRQNELARPVVEGRPAPEPGSESRLALQVRADLGHAVARVDVVGDDLAAAVGDRVASVTGSGIEVVYADLALDEPTVSWAADVLAAAGFVLAGILPLERRGTDVVRYQRLGDLAVDPADIHLRHPFGQDLLAYILDQRAAGSDR